VCRGDCPGTPCPRLSGGKRRTRYISDAGDALEVLCLLFTSVIKRLGPREDLVLENAKPKATFHSLLASPMHTSTRSNSDPLAKHPPRLLTSGKTRLAVALDRRLRGSFHDGVVFVDLSPVHDARFSSFPSPLRSVLKRRAEPPSAIF